MAKEDEERGCGTATGTAGRYGRGGAMRVLLAAAIGMALGGGALAQTVAPEAPATTVEAKSPWDAPEPWRTDRYYFQTSIYTGHFDPSDDHVNHSYLVNPEYRFSESWLEGQWIAGAAFFNNSFGQASQYVYGGLMWRPFVEAQPLYFKLTAGLLHGYKAPYDEKIPFNKYGVAPAILPSMGYCYVRYCSELIIFGTAGLMVTVGFTVP
jgi:hypothetical protein